jgi:hypothetical protein
MARPGRARAFVPEDSLSFDHDSSSADEVVGSGEACERILDAAGDLFAADGFDATPTARIARRAVVAKGLLFYYFPRKMDLLSALFAERLPTHFLSSLTGVAVHHGRRTAAAGTFVAVLLHQANSSRFNGPTPDLGASAEIVSCSLRA